MGSRCSCAPACPRSADTTPSRQRRHSPSRARMCLRRSRYSIRCRRMSEGSCARFLLRDTDILATWLTSRVAGNRTLDRESGAVSVSKSSCMSRARMKLTCSPNPDPGCTLVPAEVGRVRKSQCTEAQIVAVLHEWDSRAKTEALVRRRGVTEQKLYRWRKHGGTQVA